MNQYTDIFYQKTKEKGVLKNKKGQERPVPFYSHFYLTSMVPRSFALPPSTCFTTTGFKASPFSMVIFPVVTSKSLVSSIAAATFSGSNELARLMASRMII